MLDRDHQIFSTFPPIPQWGDVDEAEMNTIRLRRNHIAYEVRRHTRFIVGAILIGAVGLVCLVIGAIQSQQSWWTSTIIELGSVLLGIGVIGIAVDIGFQSKLAKDVFQGAFGYLLHPALRGELRWIYEFDRIVTDYDHEIEVIPIQGSEKVIVRETIRREIQPLEKAIHMKLGGGMPEYFEPDGSTRMNFCTISCEGRPQLSIGNGITVKQMWEYGKPILKFETDDEVLLEPNKPITQLWQSEVIRSRCDDIYSFFGTAALGATAHLVLPEGFDGKVLFANAHQGEMQDLTGGHYRMKAMILPLQAIRIFWWDKAKTEGWPTP